MAYCPDVIRFYDKERKIASLRMRYKLKQPELAKCLDISTSSLSNLERGKEPLRMKTYLLLDKFIKENQYKMQIRTLKPILRDNIEDHYK